MITHYRQLRALVLMYVLGTISFFAVFAHADKCVGGGTSGTLCQPTAFSDIPSFIAGALKALVVVALPIIAVFMVIAGFRFVLARGNAGELNKAKMNFFYVILGALLILGAWVIANIIGGTVNQVIGS